MTPQEQQMLQGLTERINQTQLPEKDLDAEQFLQHAIGRNPDALYILAQTVLVQQYALDQAQKQLDQLRQQQQQPKHAQLRSSPRLCSNLRRAAVRRLPPLRHADRHRRSSRSSGL